MIRSVFFSHMANNFQNKYTLFVYCFDILSIISRYKALLCRDFYLHLSNLYRHIHKFHNGTLHKTTIMLYDAAFRNRSIGTKQRQG